MIVVDTNIISYLFLPTLFSENASRLYRADVDWIAPILWQSEFRSVLALYVRQQAITLPQALAIQEEAEALMADHSLSPSSASVLTLAFNSGCSTYDCEFVALAKKLGVQLVTEDKKILREFADVAVSLDRFFK